MTNWPAFTDYKARIDPEGRFNKGKLLRGVLRWRAARAADVHAMPT